MTRLQIAYGKDKGAASEQVQFRLAAPDHAALVRHADGVGLSPGLAARELVLAGLADSGRVEVLSALAAANSELQELRRIVRNLALVQLRAGGMPAALANQAVDEALKRRGGPGETRP
jgi:hypothetical protein